MQKEIISLKNIIHLQGKDLIYKTQRPDVNYDDSEYLVDKSANPSTHIQQYKKKMSLENNIS